MEMRIDKLREENERLAAALELIIASVAMRNSAQPVGSGQAAENMANSLFNRGISAGKEALAGRKAEA